MTLRTQLHNIEKAVRSITHKKSSEDLIARWKDAFDRGMILCDDDVERTIDEWLDYLLVRPNHSHSPETVEFIREMIKKGNDDNWDEL